VENHYIAIFALICFALEHPHSQPQLINWHMSSISICLLLWVSTHRNLNFDKVVAAVIAELKGLLKQCLMVQVKPVVIILDVSYPFRTVSKVADRSV